MPLPLSLTPHVVVFATDDLAALLQSNQIPPLHQLLENFSPLGQVITRTTTLVPVTHSSFTLRFSELTQVESACREDEEARAGRTIDWISGRIAKKAAGWVEDLESRNKGEPLKGDTKWWQELKFCLDGDRVPARGEGWNHPVALILATTTLAPNPLQAVANLHTRIADFPPWVDQNLLRYTLIVHPNNRSSLTQDETTALMNATKKQYGLHCHLLSLNLSTPQTPRQLKPSPPELPSLLQTPAVNSERGGVLPHTNGVNGASTEVLNLSDEDTVNTARFIREFVTQSLVPWMERCVMEWNETYSNSRRLPLRLFSSTRRLFGSSASSSISSTMSPTSPVSTNSLPFSNAPQPPSPQRRLAEFATLLGDYKLAVPLWESIRKEGKGGSDILPLLLAPSLTLEAHAAYALAPLTTGTALGGREDIQVGAAAQLKGLVYASRWEVGVQDILQLGGEKWLVWAAGATEEAPFALLIAQAALMCLRKGFRRVAAMWYVFAANRLEKCGVKPLTMYLLKRAHELYLLPPEKMLSPSFEDVEGKDHSPVSFDALLPSIELSLGRMKYTTGDVAGAVKLFLGLLRGSVVVQGVPGDGDKVLLEDYRLAYEHLISTTSEPPPLDEFSLPVSISQASRTRRRFAALHSREGDPVDLNERTQETLEALEERWRTFWRAAPDNNKERLEKSGSGEVGEKLWVDIVVKNPLETELTLSDATILVRDIGQNEGGDGIPEGVEIEVVPEIQLGPKERRTVSFFICSSRVVSLEVTHFSFKFLSLMPVRESLGIRGRRLNDTVAQQRSVTHASDMFMRVDIKQSGGRLKVRVPRLPSSLGLGELRSLSILVTNMGTTDISELWAVFGESSNGGCILSAIDSIQETDHPVTTISSNNCLLPPEPVRIPLDRVHSSASLRPGESFELPLLVQAHQLAPFELATLLVFREDVSAPVFYGCLVEHLIDVEPVVDILVGVRPQHGKDASYLISLEIENVGSSSDIQVSNVVAVSPSWVWNAVERDLAPEVGQLPAIPGKQIMRRLESVKLASSALQTASFQYLVQKIDDVLQGRSIEKDRPPPVDLHVSVLQGSNNNKETLNTLDRIVQATRRQRLHQSLSTQFPLIPPSDRPHIFPLFTPSDLELVICWSTTSEHPRTGFSVVSGLSLGSGASNLKDVVLRAELGLDSAGKTKKTRSMYAETTREREALVSSIRNSTWNHDEDPLVVEVVAAERTEHDFTAKPLVLPVIFNIRNTSSLQAVEFSLSLTPKSALDQSQHPVPRYIGALAHRGSIPPSSTTSIRAKAWIVKPGVYSIEGWSLSCRLAPAPSDSQEVSPTSFSQNPDESNKKTVIVASLRA
ncbi:hypothetical protein FRC04_008376 [Tulasnella sp. 424]|nr:hypothetical protein FRC04_008376 [Tulasnella sp. 424]KAG8976748.1 hypothetical protein FRC05_003098 [Tulasnella sp. 425]